MARTARKKNQSPVFIAHTQPGFEVIAAYEIEALEGAQIQETRAVSDKNGMVLFHFDGDPQELLALRTTEDIFMLVKSFPDLPPTYGSLRELREAMLTLPLDPAVLLARQLEPGRGGQGRWRYRVIARQTIETSYRRVDAQEAVEKGINARTDHRWQLSEDNALEFWLTIFERETLLALRLSDEHMRHRESIKREHIPASLRPSAAAALVLLTRPNDHDVFLDPMCGAGTILIERALVGRYKMLRGGDIDERALDATQKNVGTRYKPIELQDWDARQLPLEDDSITAAAVNLPFGQQIGTVEDNRSLYPAFLREMARVLRPGARLVALTGDMRSFERALERNRTFTHIDTYEVLTLGRRARVYVVRRAWEAGVE